MMKKDFRTIDSQHWWQALEPTTTDGGRSQTPSRLVWKGQPQTASRQSTTIGTYRSFCCCYCCFDTVRIFHLQWSFLCLCTWGDAGKEEQVTNNRVSNSRFVVLVVVVVVAPCCGCSCPTVVERRLDRHKQPIQQTVSHRFGPVWSAKSTKEAAAQK